MVISFNVMKALHYLLLGGFSLCAVALIVSLYFLIQSNSRQVGQRYLLTSLCTVELLFSLVEIKMRIMEIVGMSYSQTYTKIVVFIRLMIASQYIITMHHLAIDRLLAVHWHLKYSVLISWPSKSY